jgi:1,2-diacylglycerol 3-beta-galactosyltransferase
LPQERYNAQWVREKEVGVVVPSHREIVSAVSKILAPGELGRLRSRAESLHNEAVFEIPLIFEKLLNNGSETVAAESISGSAVESKAVPLS